VDRIAQELEVVQQHYPSLERDPNLEWFVIPDFALPPGYNRGQTRLLVRIPAGYPHTPPDNFYVETGLWLASGATPPNYTEPVSLFGSSWGQFSWHAEQGSWRPAPVAEHGHNLLTFLSTARERLSEV